MEREIRQKIEELLKTKEIVLVAIDGRCAAGKTTLAKKLENEYTIVIHMDDFFLPIEKRSESIGGNIDFERLEKSLEKARKGEAFSVKRFVCRTGEFGESVLHKDYKAVIVEGTYSFHERIRQFYDFFVFCDVQGDEQLKRLKERSPEKLEDFKNIWIPREERYFKEWKDNENP